MRKLFVCLPALALLSAGAAPQDARDLLQRISVKKGICVIAGAPA